MTRFFLFLLSVASCFYTSDGMARDEYDFSWLDQDKKIFVLQNRRYPKVGHPLVTLLGNVGLSNPYRSSIGLEPRISFYFSEALGIEMFYGFSRFSDNGTYQALKAAAPTPFPQSREIRIRYGALAHWSPWYAKINVFNTVLYFDWYFSAGAGQIKTETDTRTAALADPNYVSADYFAMFAGTGHAFHLSENIGFRLDITGTFYRAPAFGTTGDTTWFSDYNFNFGVTLRL